MDALERDDLSCIGLLHCAAEGVFETGYAQQFAGRLVLFAFLQIDLEIVRHAQPRRREPTQTALRLLKQLYVLLFLFH